MSTTVKRTRHYVTILCMLCTYVLFLEVSVRGNPTATPTARPPLPLTKVIGLLAHVIGLLEFRIRRTQLWLSARTKKLRNYQRIGEVHAVAIILATTLEHARNSAGIKGIVLAECGC